MKKSSRRWVSALLILVMLVSMLPVSVLAVDSEETTNATISVESVSAAPGSTVQVAISIKDNPGILGARLTFAFDEGLTLVDAENGEAFSMLTMTKPGVFTSPCQFVWDGQELAAEDIRDGVILTLTFEVADTVTAYEKKAITMSYTGDEFFDGDLEAINVELENGFVSVISYIPGDIDKNEIVNTKDVIVLRRYLAGGYEQDIYVPAGDVDGNAVLNTKDVILLRRYLAGGYGVTPQPSPLANPESSCQHTLQEIAYKAPTETEAGNIAYWKCTTCGKCFSDANAETEISESDTILKPTGAVEPGQHTITYDIANGDPYLEKLIANGTLKNAPQNLTVINETSAFALKNLSVAGYRFVGWYDAPVNDDDANKITRISVGTTEDLQLYAIWEKITYTVELQSDLFLEQKTLTYSVDMGVSLPTPTLSNYVFTGWTDQDGKLYEKNRIPAGSTDNIILTANWTSERNKTYTKPKLDDPFIYEDTENNIILFAYEIGEIQNVPLYTIKDFGYISGDGVTKTETTTYTTTVEEKLMQAASKSIANATTQSSNWGLSNQWNETTSIDESWLTEKGYTKEEAETVSKSDTNTWNISSGRSGSTQTTVIDNTQDDMRSEAKVGLSTTDASKVSEYVKESQSESASLNTKVDVGVSSTASVENTATISGKYTQKVPGGGQGEVGASDSLKAGLSTTVSTDLSVEASTSTAVNKEGGSSVEGEKRQVKENESTDSRGRTTMHSNSATSQSSWNSSSSYGGSHESSVSKTTASALSERISKQTGYGKSYLQGGESSTSQGLASTTSSSDEYSSSTTYSTLSSVTKSSTWTTQATKPGYHRWVVAGIAHVFAVVGYDIAQDSYFVYTYSIMDDKQYEFEDYSNVTANYNDHENGVIPFEIPFYVREYVANRVSQTDGLQVDMSTGVITKYTGDYSCVVIPEYMNVGNGDVVKVTGISPDAFSGNTTIKTVILSDYITELPDNAFKDCTSLVGVAGGNIVKIGKNAFAGCTSFKEAALTEDIEFLGERAFEGVTKLGATTKSYDVAVSVAGSGAKSVTVTLGNDSAAAAPEGKTISVPTETEYFELEGNGGTFTNVFVQSNADKTVINRMTLVSYGAIPLQISSPEVILNQVSVKSLGTGLVLSAENTHLGLQGTVNIESDSENTILCKSMDIYESNPKTAGKLIPSGVIRTCGTITGRSLIDTTDDRIVLISEDTFEKMLHPHTLYLDANGGNLSDSESRKTVWYGITIGTLPIPERTNYTFAGWYTKKDGGTRVEAGTVCTATEDTTVYAHWSLNTYVLTFNANGGHCAEQQRIVTLNTAIGELPVPTRDYYTFAGWYTAADGGSAVSAKTTFGNANGTTLYAHWKLNELSGWVLKSSVPANAQIVNQKWTYNQRTNTESRETSLAGYTQYGSYWVQSGTGSSNYASFPTGYDTGNGYYTSFMKSPYSAYENTTAKREVSNAWAGYVYWHWMYDCGGSSAGNRTIYDHKGTASYNGWYYKYFGAFTSSSSYTSTSSNANYSCGSYGYPTYYNTGRTSYAESQGTRYWYRFDYYTSSYKDYYKMFKYYKVEAKESSTSVSPTDLISNVQHWVRYRPI